MTDAIPKGDRVAEALADSVRGYSYAMSRELIAIHQCKVHEDHEACAEIPKHTDNKFKFADMMITSALELARLRVRPTRVIETDLMNLKREVSKLKEDVKMYRRAAVLEV